MQRIFILLFLLLSLPVFAGMKADKPLHVRKFSQERLNRYKQDKTFEYWRYEEGKTDFYSEMGNWFRSVLNAIFGNTVTAGILSNLHWIFLGAGLLVVLIFFSRLRYEGFLTHNNPESQVSLGEIGNVPVTQLQVDELIKKAKKEGNLRLAVRYYYIKMLQKLETANLVVWEPYKTNFDYYHEISNDEIKQAFRRLSRVYEYIWYGNRDIDSRDFDELEEEFNNLAL